MLRETPLLDPNNPALTYFKGAVAASLKELANEEYLGTCSVCYMKKDLLTLNCNNSKGLHRMCGACVTDLIKYTRAHPTVGVWARVEERSGYQRDVICCRCPHVPEAIRLGVGPLPQAQHGSLPPLVPCM